MALYDFRQENCKLQLYKKGSSILCHEFDFGACGGGGGTETQTTLDSVTLNGNILEIRYTGEDGVQQLQTEDLSALITDVDVLNTLNSGHLVGTIEVNGTTFDINETITFLGNPTWDSTTGLFEIQYTDETGVVNTVSTTINPTFVNTDNQQLTGDTTGTVNLSLTPVVVGGVTNYTLKADLPKATSTPTISTVAGVVNTTNALTYDASRGGWYVIDTKATVNEYNANPLANLEFFVDLVPNTNGIDYFISGRLPLAVTTPSGGANALKIDAGGNFYVEPSSGSFTETVTNITNFAVAGNNITLSYQNETGTTDTKQIEFIPKAYVEGLVNVANGTALPTGTVIPFTGAGGTGSPYCIANATTKTIFLKGGYVYEVWGIPQVSFTANTGFCNIGIYSGATAAIATGAGGALAGTSCNLYPANSTILNSYSTMCFAQFFSPTDTYICMKVTVSNGGASALSVGNNTWLLNCKMIGKL